MNNPHSIILATLCLNEMEWLPRLYEQHKDFPGLVKWIFVESADKIYAQTNPHMTNNGLSTDGTTEFLSALAKKDSRIVHVPFGYSNISNKYPEDQGKCESRNIYLELAENIKPELLVVLDADEFYTKSHQKTISKILSITSNNSPPRMNFKGKAFCFKQRHIWYPPFLQDSANANRYAEYRFFSHEAVGGYWEVIHCRVWKWESSIRYKRNHNWPEDLQGNYLIHKGEPMMRTDGGLPIGLYKLRNKLEQVPECIHLGYASKADNRVAKHRYYEERGEGKEQDRYLQERRSMYVQCRNDYLTWNANKTLSNKARVIPYTGVIPEVFQALVTSNKNPEHETLYDYRQSINRIEQLLSSGKHVENH